MLVSSSVLTQQMEMEDTIFKFFTHSHQPPQVSSLALHTTKAQIKHKSTSLQAPAILLSPKLYRSRINILQREELLATQSFSSFTIPCEWCVNTFLRQSAPSGIKSTFL